MTRYRCESCQGVYIDPQPDGRPYYHVCPLMGPVGKGKPGGIFRSRERFESVPIEDRRDENVKDMKGKGRTELKD